MFDAAGEQCRSVLKRHVKRSPIGVYDPDILCAECDAIFAPWDDYAQKLLSPELADAQVIHDGVQGRWLDACVLSIRFAQAVFYIAAVARVRCAASFLRPDQARRFRTNSKTHDCER